MSEPSSPTPADPATAAFLAAPILWQDVPHARIAYRRFGSGPALVLVHGWPLCGFTFRKLVPLLAEAFTVYVVDVPGGGDTVWTPETDFSWPGQAASLKAFADGVGLGERFTVYGQDSGAMIARQWALIDRRIARLVMTNTEIPGHRPPWMRTFRALMFVPGTNLVFRALLRSRWFVKTKMGFGAGFENRALIDGDFYAHVIAPLAREPRSMLGHNRFLRGWSWSLLDRMGWLHAQITIPVLFVWGAADETFPLVRAEEMRAQFPDCRGLERVEGARVFVHEEQPERTAAAVIRFAAQPAGADSLPTAPTSG